MSCSVAVLLVFTRITPLLDPWSTMDNTALYPSLIGRSVMRSQAQFAKGWSDWDPFMGFSVGLFGRLFILNSWHMPHPLQ